MIIITITNEPTTGLNNQEYDYSGTDRILKNIMTGDYEVFYTGQNQGKMDRLLIDAINNQEKFKIYYRKKINTPFYYLGSTECHSIIRERLIETGLNTSAHERLQIRLVIPSNQVVNELIPLNEECCGYGKYKKAVLKHNHVSQNMNLCLGFYKIIL